MNRIEAIKAMLDGKKVRIVGSNDVYEYSPDTTTIPFFCTTPIGNVHKGFNLNASNWELVKPKVKMWRWLLLDDGGNYFTPSYYYANESEVKEEYDYYIIRKLDYTEIEV